MALPRLYKPHPNQFLKPEPLGVETYRVGRMALLTTIRRERSLVAVYNRKPIKSFVDTLEIRDNILNLQRAQHELAFLRKRFAASVKLDKKLAKKQRKSA